MNNLCCVHAASVVEWNDITGDLPTMDDDQAKALGALLRQKREELGLNSRQLGEIAGLDGTTVLRFEEGAFAAPRPDKLARVAEALGLSLADVYAMADYAVPNDLPSFRPYLRTKYRGMPAEDLEKIEAYAERLARKHGIDMAGPELGEDES
jgi:transcriptional regulator with XRE-family HTH domain